MMHARAEWPESAEQIAAVYRSRLTAGGDNGRNDGVRGFAREFILHFLFEETQQPAMCVPDARAPTCRTATGGQFLSHVEVRVQIEFEPAAATGQQHFLQLGLLDLAYVFGSHSAPLGSFPVATGQAGGQCSGRL